MSDVQEGGLITFSEEDVKSGYILQGNPDWYDLKVLESRRMDAKSGKSVNYFVKVRGEEGEMKDVVFTIMFNTSDGFRDKIKRFFVAANGGKDLVPGTPYDWKNTIGITLRGYVQRGQDQNGNSINDVPDFRPKV